MFLPSTITLKPGDSGDFVAELQRRLAGIGMFDEPAISGIYDGLTTSSVRQFQSIQGLQADGIAGPETIRRLNGAFTGNKGGNTTTANEEQEKQADRATLKDAIVNTMAASPALDPSLAAAAQDHTADAPEVNPHEAATAQDTNLMKDMQAQQQAEAAQANIDQQTQLTEMLMKALQDKQNQPTQQAQNETLKKDTMPPKEVVESEMIAQKEARETTQQAVEAAQQPTELTAQNEQIALQHKKPPIEDAAQKPQGILQKLKAYIETHLPTEALREVVHIGSRMLKAGVQHASMPDDDTARAPEAAQGRGQEQVAQRGA